MTPAGFKHSSKTKDLMSLRMREVRSRVHWSAWNKGMEHAYTMHPRSKETKSKIADGVRKFWLGKERPPWNKGRVGIYSDEYRAKISKNHRAHQTQETRELISLSHLEKNAHLTSPVVKRVIRGLARYRVWRSGVFCRDGFACQVCGFVGKPSRVCATGIQADHCPLSFIEIITKYRIKTTMEAIACDVLWDISNGRTICSSCHKKTFSAQRLKQNSLKYE